MTVERFYYKADILDGYRQNRNVKIVDDEAEANLRSSEVKVAGMKKLLMRFNPSSAIHAPALDIDRIHCELKPSSTEGNFHLYIDKPMTWENYKKLLTVLFEVGIIEESFYDLSLRDKKSYLRTKHKREDP